ncbi:MAG: trypsin-like peptidase domain-containing protein [Deltaproteobacteria bacterium]|nr:trypsin-like peptidase domain-containing protein [Deltaproteobacteria bacterium]
MAPPVSRDRLELPNDPVLIWNLGQLGIYLAQEEGDPGKRVLYREASERIGVPFEFFQRFARLASPSSNPLFRKDSARTLLERKKTLDRGSSVSTTGNPAADALRKFLDRAFEQSLEPLLSEDTEINSDEALVLRAVLEALDHWSPDRDPLPTTPSPTLLYPDRTKAVISEVMTNNCWLSEEALRVGFLGAINGWRNHHLHDEITEEGRVQSSTMAVESPCDYLPSLHYVMKGLFYRLDQVPDTVQRAAQSAVMIQTERGWGSGVVVDRNYILTNRHELSRLFASHDPQRFPFPRTQVTIRFRNQGRDQELRGSFEVISFPPFSDEIESRLFLNLKSADLVLLYVPSLPETVPPISFAANFLGEEHGISTLDTVESNTPVKIRLMNEHLIGTGYVIPFSTTFRVYRPGPLFVIGYPAQEEGSDLLASTGRVYGNRFMTNAEGLLRTTAVALPGNSGGPVVDLNGNLVGILTAADSYRKYEASEPTQQGILDAPIAGSKIYAIDLIGGAVRWLIKAHRTKKWPKVPEYTCKDSYKNKQGHKKLPICAVDP